MVAIKQKKGQECSTVAVNPYFIEAVQPQGGISFRDESVICTGTGFETCIHVYRLPSQVSDQWLRSICNMDDTVVSIDIHTENIYEVRKNLNKSINEQKQRQLYAQNAEEAVNAARQENEMQTLLWEVSSMGESIKTVHIRIFVYDKTHKDLEDKVRRIQAELESNSYEAAIYLNESKNEWMSVWESYDEQVSHEYSTRGMPVNSTVLAAGNPFHFSSLEDRFGDYLGWTPCGGSVIFDMFHKSADRLYYNALVAGEMGSGKTTLLKKQMLSRAMRGDFVRVFDIKGDFRYMTTRLGGTYLCPDGTGGMLNPLEILASSRDEATSFSMHISKMVTIYTFLYPSATDEHINFFRKSLREMYGEFNMGPDKINTGRPSEDYPIFSDFLDFLERKIERIKSSNCNIMESVIAERELINLSSLKDLIGELVNTYGSIFNGHTSLDNILDEQIVAFDLTTLKEMEPRIFDAQVFNMLTLCWDNCIRTGVRMKELFDTRKIREEDIIHFLILIDESHRWINTDKVQAVTLVSQYMREARAFFGGIVLASQSIRDFITEGSGNSKIEKLKDIFELTQYKFIFRQTSSAINLIDRVFGGILTESQKERIVHLAMGEALLSVSADTSLQFTVSLSEKEDEIFQGGR